MNKHHRWIPTAAVTVAAALGTAAGTPSANAWYRSLNKPAWQPDAKVFPAVWTPLYAVIAYAGTRTLRTTAPVEQRCYLTAYCTNLALNAAWTWIFFKARNPKAALVEVLLLQASGLDLLRRSLRADRRAAAALAPYVAWTGFATALNTAIVRRNRPKAHAQAGPRPASSR